MVAQRNRVASLIVTKNVPCDIDGGFYDFSENKKSIAELQAKLRGWSPVATLQPHVPDFGPCGHDEILCAILHRPKDLRNVSMAENKSVLSLF